MNALDFERRYQERYAEARSFSKKLTGPALVDELVALPEAARAWVLEQLTEHDLAAMAYAWEAWARPKQCPTLSDEIRILLFLGGRGAGKSTSGAQFIRSRVDEGARAIGLLGPTIGEIERWMLGLNEDDEGLLNVFPPNQRPEYIARDEIVRFHTGAVGYLSSAENPEFRGPNLDTAWGDEVMKWRYLVPLWDNLELATRKSVLSRWTGLYMPPRICVTTTPRPKKWLRERVVDPETLTILLRSEENTHVDDRTKARWRALFGGTRQGAEQLDGEILEDSAEALFSSRIVDETRVVAAPMLSRIVIAIDPARTTGEKSDATGIVVVGIDSAGELYVLADLTGSHAPMAWGKLAVDAFIEYDAEAFVVENNGVGEFVEAVLRVAMARKRGELAADAMKIESVFAKTSMTKYDRAAPVSALHKRERLHIVGHAMPELESEMTEWNPKLGKRSPNRLDALVWGVWYLAELASEAEPDPHQAFVGLEKVTTALMASGSTTASRDPRPSQHHSASRSDRWGGRRL